MPASTVFVAGSRQISRLPAEVKARLGTMIEKGFQMLQFRLTSAVRLAVTGNRQPLDLPIEWTHGQHRVRYEEIALRQDQADFAAAFLQVCHVPHGRYGESGSRSRSQVFSQSRWASRLSDFPAHSKRICARALSPTWSIDPDCPEFAPCHSVSERKIQAALLRRSDIQRRCKAGRSQCRPLPTHGEAPAMAPSRCRRVHRRAQGGPLRAIPEIGLRPRVRKAPFRRIAALRSRSHPRGSALREVWP